MSRIKYGIDLGTTNSAIAELNKGKSIIKKNLNQDDTTPSCVGFRRGVMVGKKAVSMLKKDREIALSSGKQNSSNVFQEFKRTMGTDHKYHSELMNKSYSPQELSSEVLKSLKSQVQEDFRSVIITIPAMFNDSQRAATVEAANLAGFSQVELLQEPIAAATAFGVDEEIKDGYILVFDFGGGTFDVCLIQVQDGIMQVKDTGGDNWLGGKNLDEAIVDKIILPKLKENYKIDSYINDELKSHLLSSSLKDYAEDVKKILSFNETCELVSDLDAFPDDDEGNEIMLDFDVTKEELESAIGPIFKKAIDISLEVLDRNNLKGNDLASLLLVGGPTFSPILRTQIEKDICKPNTNVDPMTVVARGAAIYASRFEISEDIKDETRDVTKIQLELAYESQSVETTEFLAVSIDKSKTSGEIPDEVYLSINRNDGGWSSEKILLNESGEMIDLNLYEGKANSFELVLNDKSGNILASEPSEITIIQGVKTGKATLAYNYGIEVGIDSKVVFKTVSGLEKNKTMPVTGELLGLKTKKEIRPGSNDDYFKIPIYMGDDGADGTRATSHVHVNTIKISGIDFPKLLPMNSDINLYLEIISDSEKKLSVDIPYLNEVFELPLEKMTQENENDDWFEEQFNSFDIEINALEEQNSNFDVTRLSDIKDAVEQIKLSYHNRKNDGDTKMMTRDNIRKQFAELDRLINDNEWPSVKSAMEQIYSEIIKKVNDSEDVNRHQTQLNNFRAQMDRIIDRKDVKLAKDIDIQMRYYYRDLLESEYGADLYIGLLQNYNDNFSQHPWQNPTRAREILNTALQNASVNPTKESMKNYVSQLWNLLPREGGGRDDILGG